MGNSSPRYVSNAEAVAIFGGHDRWTELKLSLERIAGSYVDYPIFAAIIMRKFKKMPKILFDLLFRAFSADISKKVDIESFLTSCAALESNNYILNCRFLYRVYENEYGSGGGGSLQRKGLEDVLNKAYGDESKQQIHNLMEKMFSRTVSQELSLKEFESQSYPLDLLKVWVKKVLECFLLPAGNMNRLYLLERKYSSQLEAKELMRTQGLSAEACSDLRRRFSLLCAGAANCPAVSMKKGNNYGSEVQDQIPGNDGSSKGVVQVLDMNTRDELQLSGWLGMVAFRSQQNYGSTSGSTQGSTCENRRAGVIVCPCSHPYMHETLAEVLFRSRVDGFKPNWRFGDFAHFCSVFGKDDRHQHATAITEAFIHCALADHYAAQENKASTNKDVPTTPIDCPDLCVIQALNKMITVLAMPISPNSSGEESTNNPAWLEQELSVLNNQLEPGEYAAAYSSLVLSRYSQLPGMKDLGITACCLFGCNPKSPLLEMEYITELSRRHIHRCPQSSSNPYGPAGTEWCVVPKQWIDSWRMYVGHHNSRNQLGKSNYSDSGGRSPRLISNGIGSGSGKRAAEIREEINHTLVNQDSNKISSSNSIKRGGIPPPKPGPLNNSTILKRKNPSSGANQPAQLLPFLVCGKDVEVVCPAVHNALVAWYGGGPSVVRRVVTATTPAQRPSPHSPRPNVGYGFTGNNSTSKADNRKGDDDDVTGTSELELYPLSINIHTCDRAGYMNPTPLCVDLLFSKTNTVNDIALYLCSEYTVNMSQVRLWNYVLAGREHWRDQFMLSPELTLHRANIQNGQTILLEVSLPDGSWPRSLLHSYLDGEERAQQTASTGAIQNDAEGGGDVDQYTGASLVAGNQRVPALSNKSHHMMNEPDEGADISLEAAALAQSSVSALSGLVESVLGTPFPSGNAFAGHTGFSKKASSAHAVQRAPIPLSQRNNGRVGMDNLGNTCYLNCSLQALLHTPPLVEYFLSNAYLRHLNLKSKHGFRGRLAGSFGQLVRELWSTTERYITPRFFKYDIANLHDQFAGNEQHDAHELLAFLLDGLSEDLNLVCDKPYTEQPDSDGRSDSILADIWWDNHLKRDRSVIQALFSGQFKSVMTCTEPGCGYSSARFEPFNFLSVPVPDELETIIGVTVVPLSLQQSSFCEVRVARSGTLQDIANRVVELGLAGITGPVDCVYFQAGEMVNNRVRSFHPMERRVMDIRESENLVLYQVRRQAGDIPPLSPRPENPSNTDTAGTTAVTTAGTTRVEQNDQKSAAEAGFVAESLYHGSYCSSVRWVRVALCQRRVQLVNQLGADSDVADGGGNNRVCELSGSEYFQLEHFGISSLEVLPNRIRCGDLYRLVASKYAQYLKVPVIDLIRHRRSQWQQQQQRLRHTSSSSSMSNLNVNTTEAVDVRKIDFSMDEEYPVNIRYDVIRTASTDEVIGGAIPEEGFTLRLISGGRNAGANACCSRCPWIDHCEGCVLPDHNEVEVELRDGESVAIDWHFSVFEDLLDKQAVCALKRDSTALNDMSPGSGGNRRSLNYISTPLQRCLDKFTEQEKLEDVVCPRCKRSDGNMCKSFTLWRMPPVLIIQLKRFQFDHISRRKLNNHIDFPLENLDLFAYLADTRKRTLSVDANSETRSPQETAQKPCYSPTAVPTDSISGVTNDVGESMSKSDDALAHAALYGDGDEFKNETTGSDSPNPKVKENISASQCTKYDLYSVIRHDGAMGGGHYTNTTRTLHSREGDKDKITKAMQEEEGSWYYYNDNLVHKVEDPRLICSSSAYVLFYMRQDMLQGDVLALLKKQMALNADTDTNNDNNGEIGNESSGDQIKSEIQSEYGGAYEGVSDNGQVNLVTNRALPTNSVVSPVQSLRSSVPAAVRKLAPGPASNQHKTNHNPSPVPNLPSLATPSSPIIPLHTSPMGIGHAIGLSGAKSNKLSVNQYQRSDLFHEERMQVPASKIINNQGFPEEEQELEPDPVTGCVPS